MSFQFSDFIDILGTFSFAVSGAFAAIEKRLDPFGVLILAFITAIGGGTVRDLLTGNTPVTWLQHPSISWVIHPFDIYYPHAGHPVSVAFAGLVPIKIRMDTFCLYKKT
jgi:uncharacterized membrane protein YeiH